MPSILYICTGQDLCHQISGTSNKNQERLLIVRSGYPRLIDRSLPLDVRCAYSTETYLYLQPSSVKETRFRLPSLMIFER